MSGDIEPGVGLAAADDAVDALATRYAWQPQTVSFAFATGPGHYAGAATSFNEEKYFLPLSAAGRDMVRNALSLIDAVAELDFVEIAPAGGADIAIGGSSVVPTAWAYLPDGSTTGGDIWVGVDKGFNALFTASTAKPHVGSYEHYVAIHEAFHAIGLKHPHESFAGNSDRMALQHDALEYTVMSYRSYVGSPANVLTASKGHFPQSPMMLDILAAQRLYGAEHDHRAGDTVYAFRPDRGEMTVDGAGTGATVANVVFRTLWDGGGTDTIDLRAYATDTVIDLTPGAGIDLHDGGTAQRARLGTDGGTPIHAPRHVYMSMLFDDGRSSLIENALGGSGGDVFVGNAADNMFDGGAGHDVAVFAGPAAAYTVTIDGGNAIVESAATGRDRLLGVEALRFDDSEIVLSDDSKVVEEPQPQPQPPALLMTMNGVATTGGDPTPFGGQDAGVAEIAADMSGITLTRNAWKSVALDLQITADTVLSFDFAAEKRGEIHAIGFSDGGTVDSGRFFQLEGSQGWGLRDGDWAYSAGSGTRSYEIEVGRHFTGDFDRLVFAMDDDRRVGADSTFSDIALVTAPNVGETGGTGESGTGEDTGGDVPDPGTVLNVTVAGKARVAGEPAPFGGQDAGVAAFAADNSGITLTRNAWKSVALETEVTADTVLSFDFAAEKRGEIHAIGFSNGGAPNSGRFFQLEGSQGWGLRDGDWAYSAGSGTRSYEIEVGRHFTGDFDMLVFAMDDDRGVGADSTFSDIAIA